MMRAILNVIRIVQVLPVAPPKINLRTTHVTFRSSLQALNSYLATLIEIAVYISNLCEEYFTIKHVIFL